MCRRKGELGYGVESTPAGNEGGMGLDTLRGGRRGYGSCATMSSRLVRRSSYCESHHYPRGIGSNLGD